MLLLVGFHITAPIPQDLAYHEFADDRRLLGVPNFFNAVSNIPFLVFGALGLNYVRRYVQEACLPRLQAAYVVFFAGVLGTAFGSAYYHLDPNNASLVWDRVPMTIGFAGLFAVVIGEFVSVRIARLILAPLIGLGLFSVGYWAVTEAAGHGDLRLYAVVQFLPMLLVPVILLTRAPMIGSRTTFWLVIGFYAAAKVFEYFDEAVFSAGRLLSGHTLKHLFASLAPATVFYALTRRRG